MDQKLYGICLSLSLDGCVCVYFFDIWCHHTQVGLFSRFFCTTVAFSFDESILLKITLFHFRSGSKKKTLKFPTSSAVHGNRQRWNTIQYNAAQHSTEQQPPKKNGRIYHIYRKAREKKVPYSLSSRKDVTKTQNPIVIFKAMRTVRAIREPFTEPLHIHSLSALENDLS